MKKTIRAIIFDLDGTLYNDTEAFEYALKIVGLSLSHSLYRRAREEVKNQVGRPHTSSHNRLLYFKRFLEKTRRYSAEKLLSMMDQYENALTSNIRQQWKRLERNRLIKRLSHRHTMVVLSNETLHAQLVKMRAIDPKSHFFKSLVTSEEVGVEKPNPRMFQAALLKLRLPTQKCLVVGDDPKNDIEPARRMGFHTLLTKEFSRGAIVDSKTPTIDALDQLPGYLHP